ncbi:MAG: ATP-binding protein [Coleofasciculus sp. F4-SAH-05]
MPKWFNTAGPCKADIHYMLSPIARLPQLDPLIEQQGYFVIHAPRQTGKTTAMLALAQQLTASGQYAAVMVSAEVGAAFPHDPGVAENAMLGSWRENGEDYLPTELHPPEWSPAEPGQRIQSALRAWAKASPLPFVLFIDEIDALQDETLISVLRQLRSGYPKRPQRFPHSLGLIGVRDVRDYKVASGGSNRLNTSSPFNIKIKSLGDIPNDDVQFLIDLGLCRMSSQGGLAIANPIYQEVLPRVLSQTPPISDRTTTESANTPGNLAIVVIRG